MCKTNAMIFYRSREHRNHLHHLHSLGRDHHALHDYNQNEEKKGGEKAQRYTGLLPMVSDGEGVMNLHQLQCQNAPKEHH